MKRKEGTHGPILTHTLIGSPLLGLAHFLAVADHLELEFGL